MMIDYNFSYKYSVRFIIINKYYIIKNTYSIPLVEKLVYSFILSKIENLNDAQIYNYGYLFKYFFGRSAFITRIKSFFRSGIWSYSFKVSVIISGKDVLSNFIYLITDFVLKADKIFIKSGIYNKQLKIFYIIIKDLNLFSEKKTNLGLFHLYQDLNLQFFRKGIDFASTSYSLKNLKIRLC